MDKVTMLARLRSVLDESSEVLYDDDDELYPALTLAQLELATVLAKQWKEKSKLTPFGEVLLPKTLHTVIQTDLTSAPTIPATATITKDALEIIYVQYQFDGSIVLTSPYAIELGENDRAQRLRQNPFLEDGEFYWWNQNTIYLSPEYSGAGQASVKYIYIPTDITSAIDPILDEVSHDAIVERACWILLKDRETEQAKLHLEMYVKLLGGLM